MKQETTTFTVVERSSVDISDPGTVRGEFQTREEAETYIAENTIDGTNVSEDSECNYLSIAEDDDE